ncbi:MAG: glycerophosphodiester phosphodiesterase family protein [Verrucomicrobia bacterium]|nr:glycerophosphodiester phosphodiesterase family protein [Verrucomicrobiota bacterium]
MIDWTMPKRPYSIAHRGASAYAFDNTIMAFEKAVMLGADMWEVDIRRTMDDRVVVHHDRHIADGRPIDMVSYAEVLQLTTAAGRPCPLLEEVVQLAARHGAGIYADIKDLGATLPTLHALRAHGITRAIIGAFDTEAVQILREVGCEYPRAALVPLGVDPFVHGAGADIIHLCWEEMDRPQDTLTEDMFERAFAAGQRIAIWHEEDPVRMAAIRTRPVIGICSDRPEMVNPFEAPAEWPVQIVSHRGANAIAPENTLPALECAYAAGFSHVEVDLRQTSDGGIVVIHDRTLNRTTNGRGLVADATLSEIRALDAGSWFDPFFEDTRAPLLEEILHLAQKYGGQLMLELKTAGAVAVWNAVTRAALQDRCFFWSLDRQLMLDLQRHAPEARLMARRQDYGTLREAMADYSASIIEFTHTEDLDELAVIRDARLLSLVAYMGADTEIIDKLIARRPDMLNVDQPFLVARRIDAHFSHNG